MKSFCRFLIAALAIATPTLPSVYAQEWTLSCMDCKNMGSSTAETPLQSYGECAAEEACIFKSDQVLPDCRSYSETPCNCSEGNTGCDPYDNTKTFICDGDKIRSEKCPTGQVCTGSGDCTEPTQSGGQDSGTTKPATCSADNANTRYPHETDCKKFYLCLEIIVVYVYVELTCPWSFVYNKVTASCDHPQNVPDCQQ